MSWIIGDGWDYYANNTDVGRGQWDPQSNTSNMQLGTPGRFYTGSFGQYARFSGGNQLCKTWGSNESTIYIACAIYRPGALSSATNNSELSFSFMDGPNNLNGSAQCSVAFCQDGTIKLFAGNAGSGTVLATYANAFTNDLWFHFQIRVVISNTAGTFTVRKNGSVTDSFTATGLNTRNGTTNNYTNCIGVAGGSSGWNTWCDDLLMFSGSGAAPNTWVGDCRAICLPVASDTAQKNFAPSSSTGVTVSPTNSQTGASTFAANLIVAVQMAMASRAGSLTKISVTLNAAFTGNIRAAVYLNDGAPHPIGSGPWGNSNEPKTLLGQSAVVTNPAAGIVDFAFTGGPVIDPTMQVWAAFLADGSWQTTQNSWAYSTPGRYELSRSYASGFPTPAPAWTGAAPNGPTCTFSFISNAVLLSDPVPTGDTDYVLSSNVNDEDLYGIMPLPVTPFAIIGVVSKVYIRKSDAGTRQGQLRVKSGATEVGGVDTAVSSTYQYLMRNDPVDPNTSAAWTLAAINALQLGQKVTL